MLLALSRAPKRKEATRAKGTEGVNAPAQKSRKIMNWHSSPKIKINTAILREEEDIDDEAH